MFIGLNIGWHINDASIFCVVLRQGNVNNSPNAFLYSSDAGFIVMLGLDPGSGLPDSGDPSGLDEPGKPGEPGELDDLGKPGKPDDLGGRDEPGKPGEPDRPEGSDGSCVLGKSDEPGADPPALPCNIIVNSCVYTLSRGRKPLMIPCASCVVIISDKDACGVSRIRRS